MERDLLTDVSCVLMDRWGFELCDLSRLLGIGNAEVEAGLHGNWPADLNPANVVHLGLVYYPLQILADRIGDDALRFRLRSASVGGRPAIEALGTIDGIKSVIATLAEPS